MIVQRRLWVVEVDAQTLGIPGAMQIFRIDRKVEQVRRGKVTKTTTEIVHGVTSLLPDWQRKNMRNPNALIRLLVSGK